MSIIVRLSAATLATIAIASDVNSQSNKIDPRLIDCNSADYIQGQDANRNTYYAVCGGGQPGSKEFVADWTEATIKCAVGKQASKIESRLVRSSLIQVNFRYNPPYFCDTVFEIVETYKIFNSTQIKAAKAARQTALTKASDMKVALYAKARAGDAAAALEVIIDDAGLERMPFRESGNYNLWTEMAGILAKNNKGEALLEYLSRMETRYPVKSLESWGNAATLVGSTADLENDTRKESIKNLYLALYNHEKSPHTALKWAQISTFYAQKYLRRGHRGENAEWGRQAHASALSALETVSKTSDPALSGEATRLRQVLSSLDISRPVALVSEDGRNRDEILTTIVDLIGSMFITAVERYSKMTPQERARLADESKRQSDKIQEEQANFEYNQCFLLQDTGYGLMPCIKR